MVKKLENREAGKEKVLEERKPVVRYSNTRVLPKKYLFDFLEGIKKFGNIYGPVEKEKGCYIFSPLTDIKKLVLDYQRTILPPKKFVYPSNENLFQFTAEEGFLNPSEEPPRQILFGIHPCDIHGLSILDEVFSRDYPDVRYFSRRNRTAIIGLSCLPDDKCFCQSMNTDYVAKGFDLHFTDIGEDYFIRIGTSLGEDMVRINEALFGEVHPSHISSYKDFANRKSDMFSSQIDLTILPQILELEYRSEIWEELGRKCLSCGTCSLVCPTCYCYEVYDYLNLDQKGGLRVRQWDSCLLRDYAIVAGGHNFRPERSTRIKLRYYHKQVAFTEEYGRPSCVGCGRCIATCPAGIDILEVIRQIRGEKE
jgi:sulfhydrogenase subunit beta (sulfur reductase)